jgi:hypothetical protein
MTTTSNLKPSTAQPSKSTTLAIALALLSVSVTLNILSARRLTTLRHTIATMESQRMLGAGATVPDIVGLGSDGSPTTLRYGDVAVPTVLYIFTPQCRWCKKNIANFHALIDQAGSRYRVVGIALTRQDLDLYMKNENLHLPVYSDIRSDLREIYRLGGTPETIVVSPDNKVLNVWYGAYEEQIRPNIENFLQIHLPGCCQGTLTSSR